MTMTVTMTVDGKGDDENDSKDDRSVTSVSLLRATPLPAASLLQSMISLMMMTKIKMMMIIWRKGVLQIICHNFVVNCVFSMRYVIFGCLFGTWDRAFSPFSLWKWFCRNEYFQQQHWFCALMVMHFFTWILHQEFIQIVKHFDSYPRSVTTQQYTAQHNTHYTTPYYTKLYYTTQHHTILNYTVFQRTTMHSQVPSPTCFYEQIGLGTWL